MVDQIGSEFRKVLHQVGIFVEGGIGPFIFFDQCMGGVKLSFCDHRVDGRVSKVVHLRERM